MNDFEEIERMTLHEYYLRMTAYKLRWLDKENFIHELAWANQEVQAQEKRGRKYVPVYNTFEKFFDKDKLEKEILGIEEVEQKDNKLMQLVKQANERR